VGPVGRVNVNYWTSAEGHNRVDVSLPSPQERNRSSFRNIVFYSYLELQVMDIVHKPSDSEPYFRLEKLMKTAVRRDVPVQTKRGADNNSLSAKGFDGANTVDCHNSDFLRGLKGIRHACTGAAERTSRFGRGKSGGGVGVEQWRVCH
jgi:hypothetical protein